MNFFLSIYIVFSIHIYNTVCRLQPPFNGNPSKVCLDSLTASLLPYNSDLSGLPFSISHVSSDSMLQEGNIPVDLSHTCSKDTDLVCPNVVTILSEDTLILSVRIMEPFSPYPRSRSQLAYRLRQGLPAFESAYSYSFPLTIQAGVNYIAWCSSTPLNFQDSDMAFSFDRPNLWLVPHSPASSLQYYALRGSSTPTYEPIPSYVATSYPLPCFSIPPVLGLLSSGVPSLLMLAQLAAGPDGLYHPHVRRVHPWASQTTYHSLISSIPV